jgi:hypothetical protein
LPSVRNKTGKNRHQGCFCSSRKEIIFRAHSEIDNLTRKLLTPLQLETLRQNKSVDVSLSVSNARLRVNVFTTMRGISIAIRLLPGHIPTIVETSKDEGMFTSERYLTYYLKNRSTFSPYGNVFRPLEELSQNNFYQSPLTETQHVKHAAKQSMKTASQPIIAVSEYSEETEESILNINDNISLHRLVEKLNKNSK